MIVEGTLEPVSGIILVTGDMNQGGEIIELFNLENYFVNLYNNTKFRKMSTQILDKKIELIQWLSSLEDKAIIDKLLEFRKAETKDWWETISSEEKNSIAKGIADAEKKKLKPHSSARKLYEKWL